MNEDKNINVEIIADKIRERVLDRCLTRPNPLLGTPEEVSTYLDKFHEKMNNLLPNKSNNETK